MKEMLGRHLGATLVESVPAGWLDDPDVENMKTTFDIAVAQITPVLFPQLLYGLSAAGDPDFAAFAARIEPTEFAPGVMKGSGTMQPVDWMLRWAEGLEPAPLNLNLRSVVSAAGGEPRTFRFHMSQYLLRRARDWADRGYTETLDTVSDLNARSKFCGDDQRAAFKNWEDVGDLRNPFGESQSIAEMIQQRELLNRVIMKVMQELRPDD
jgi:amidase